MSIVSAEAGRVPSMDDETRTWQQAMQDAIRRTDDLLRLVGLESKAGLCDPSFPLFVPREFAARIVPGDARDPLLRQVLPTIDERTPGDGFVPDPVGDHAARTDGGLLQKYEGRALWVLTGVCPVHCRYCFRQHYDYRPHSAHQRRVLGEPFGARGLAWLRAQSSVEEVIFSGGDPLSLEDDKLDRLLQQLDAVSHLRRLRIHTRMPVMIPQRITADLISAFRKSRLTVFFVVHINHVQEIDAAVQRGLGKLIDAGIPVLNQAVLLAGVNDHPEALVSLSRRLIDLRVLPYYLHQLDRVKGATHFEVPVEEGRRLMRELRRRLPGYAVPRYVREVPGELNKRVLA